jgi:hypothetical protein
MHICLRSGLNISRTKNKRGFFFIPISVVTWQVLYLNVLASIPILKYNVSMVLLFRFLETSRLPLLDSVVSKVAKPRTRMEQVVFCCTIQVLMLWCQNMACLQLWATSLERISLLHMH